MTPAKGYCLAFTLLFTAPAMAADPKEEIDTSDDGAQRLDSPLGMGTGVTFTGSKDKTSLGVALAGQTASGFLWQTAVEGKVADQDSTSVPSFNGGQMPGITVKLGGGYGSFESNGDAEYLSACNTFMQKVQARRRLEKDQRCQREVESLAAGLGKPLASKSDSCSAALIRFATALRIATDHEDPALQGISAGARRALEETLAEAVVKGKAASDATQDVPVATPPVSPLAAQIAREKEDEGRAYRELAPETEHFFVASSRALQSLDALKKLREESDAEDKKIRTIPSCNEVARTAKEQWIRELYRDEVAPHDGAVRFRVTLSALAEVKQTSYRGADATGAYDLATKQNATSFLPGAMLDFVGYLREFVGGVGLGYRRTSEASPVDVCKETSVGEYSTRECTKAALGKPKVADEVFGTVAFQVNPVSRGLGFLAPGAELLAQVSTKNTQTSLFGKSSWTFLVAMPLFLAGSEAPGGLRAGIAPELTIPTTGSEKTDLTIVAFVGTRYPNQAPK